MSSRCKKPAVDHEGTTYPSIQEMCDKWKIPRAAFDIRIKNGWALEKALTVPIGAYSENGKKSKH